MSDSRDTPLSTKVIDGVLTISIGVGTLVFASRKENGFTCEPEIKIDGRKAVEFAKDVAREMDRQEEDGTTPLDLFIEEMMVKACDSGSVAQIIPK